jgi:hypothetical protein
VRSQDIDAVRERFLQYTKAGGEVLPGLVRRRLAEFDWIGSGTAQPRMPATGPAAAAPADGSRSPAATTQAAAVGALSADSLQPESPPLARTALIESAATGPTGEGTDAHAAQSLSMLVSLLFDLQMRSELADPMRPTETRAERQERSA